FFCNRDACQRAIAVDELGGGNFIKVVIFARNPEDWNGFDAALCQAVGKFYRGQCFVNRVERSAEKTGLLTGDYCDAVRFTQALNVFECFFARPPGAIHFFQRAAESVSIGLVVPKDPLAAVWKVIMMLYRFRIKFSQ